MSCRGGNHLTPDGATSCHCGDVVQVAAVGQDATVERVARAIAEADGQDLDRLRLDQDPKSWSYEDFARAALATLAALPAARPTCQQPHGTGVGITMRCQQPAGHDGQHRDSSGGEWPAT